MNTPRVALFVLVAMASCAGEEGAPPSAAPDLGSDEGADTTTPPPADVATPDPDVPAPPEDAPADSGSPPACVEGQTATVAAVVAPAGPLAVATQGATSCVAWVDGETVRARLVDLAGAPAGEALDLHTEAAPVSSVEVLPIDGGFAIFFSRGLLASAANTEDVVLYQVRIALDASVTMPPTPLYTRFQLGRGAAVSDAGFHLLGVRDGEDLDTGELFRQASMARATLDGEPIPAHFMLKADKFTYMRMHQNGYQVCSPHVGSGPNQPLSYFLTNIFLPCGLPVPTVMELGPSATVVASSYQSNVAMWLVREAEGPGRLVMVDTASVSQEGFEVPLPFAPSDLAELSLEPTDFVLYLDAVDGALTGVTIAPAQSSVSAAEALDPVPASVLAIRAVAHEAAWTIAWLESDRVQVRQRCFPPELP